MGGCCCSASGRSESTRAHVYNLRGLEEQLNQNESSPSSGGIIVDTNLDTSIPDTYRAPPAPLPYNASLAAQNPDARENLEKSESKGKIDSEEEPLKGGEDDTCQKTVGLATTEDEDDCPICLEEYDKENPRYFTKCEHDFHLACLLEWMERSETCPVCDQILVIDEMYE